MKQGFILYKSFYEPIKDLTLEEKGELFDMIFQYQKNPNNPVGFSNPKVLMAFNFFKNQFEIDEEKYNNVSKRNEENGKKGGRPRLKNPNNPVGSEKPKKADKDKDKDKDKDIDKERDTEKPEISRSYLKNIPVEDIKEFLINFTATEKQIRDKGEALYDWCLSNGKVKKDYKATLRNALRKDYPKKSSLDEPLIWAQSE